MKRKIYESRVYVLDLSEILFELLDKNIATFREKLSIAIKDLLKYLNEKNEDGIRRSLEELFNIVSEFKGFLLQDNLNSFENLRKELKKFAKVVCQSEDVQRMLISFLSGLQEEIKQK